MLAAIGPARTFSGGEETKPEPANRREMPEVRHFRVREGKTFLFSPELPELRPLTGSK